MAGSVNKVIILGNVTKDIELKELAGGSKVCAFGIATNRSWKNKEGEKQEEVEFHNIVMWGKLAEIAAQYVKKGNKLYIEGRLKTREWEDKEGKKRYMTEIVADEMVMLTAKPKDGSTGPDTTNNKDMGGIETVDEAPVEEINPADIPF